jgi:hypothetical protein
MYYQSVLKLIRCFRFNMQYTQKAKFKNPAKTTTTNQLKHNHLCVSGEQLTKPSFRRTNKANVPTFPLPFLTKSNYPFSLKNMT